MALSIKKVLISDAVDASCVEILENNGIQVTLKTDFTKAQLLKEIENYDALIVRSATKVTSDVIEAGQKLKVIGRAGTGVDNIDCNAATRQGVLVINAPGGNTVSAAELTCAMVITLSREIPAATSSLKAGKWDRKMFMGNELYGKTLAIVGLGRIGKEVATRMQSFGMKTIGFDPIVPAEVSQEFGVESMTLDRLWPLADYITVHTPLIPQTKHLINKDTLGKCKKGVKIINVARGGIVHEDDLLAALESGHCGGAGLDVFVEEPPKNHALIGHPKVVCTPHLGANTREAQLRVAQEIAEQFVDLTVGQSVPGVVNAPALAQTQVPENKPWADLCVALGKVASALVGPSNGLQLELTTRGAALAGKAKFLCTAAAIGVLKQLGRSNANFINVSALAPEAKIEMLQKHEEKPSCCLSGEVSLDIKCGTTTHTLVGSVAGDRLFLCSIDGAAFEPRQVLSGALLFGVGQDSPNALVQIMGELVGQGISVLSASRCTGGFYVFSTGSPVSTQSRPPVAPLKFWSYVNFNN